MLNIKLLASPFSINSAYYLKGNGKVRTQECRQWGDAILEQLQQYSIEIEEFSKNYDTATSAIEVQITHFIPSRYFFNYEKTISSRSPDITNIEKLLVDLIFDSRFYDRPINGMKVKNLNINDKNIISCISKKRPSYEWRIEVTISTVPLPLEEINLNESEEKA